MRRLSTGPPRTPVNFSNETLDSVSMSSDGTVTAWSGTGGRLGVRRAPYGAVSGGVTHMLYQPSFGCPDNNGSAVNEIVVSDDGSAVAFTSSSKVFFCLAGLPVPAPITSTASESYVWVVRWSSNGWSAPELVSRSFLGEPATGFAPTYLATVALSCSLRPLRRFGQGTPTESTMFSCGTEEG